MYIFFKIITIREQIWLIDKITKLFQCTVMMGSVVFLSAAAFQKISDGQTNKAENISKEGAQAKTAAETEVNEETEEPFINILEAESSEMTITWDAAFSRR